MCVVSMIMDHYGDKWGKPVEVSPPSPLVPVPSPFEPFPLPPPMYVPMTPPKPKPAPVTDEEIDEFRRLLERAREYDRKTNQHDCESADKKKRLQKLADELGIGDKVAVILKEHEANERQEKSLLSRSTTRFRPSRRHE